MDYPHKAGNDGRGDSGNDRGSMAHLATVAFQEMINAKARSYEGQTKPSYPDMFGVSILDHGLPA